MGSRRRGTALAGCKAALVACGINNTGERQNVGCALAADEMETAWRGFLEGLVPAASRESSLSSRTPTRAYGPESEASSTARPGSGAPGTSCATCWAGCPATRRASRRRPCAPCSASPTGRWRRKLLAGPSRYSNRSPPDAAQVIRNAGDGALAFTSFPEKHWRQLKSTDPLERLNREIRRRTDVVGIFPNDASVLRLVTMLLVEQNDEWAVGRRDFSEGSMTAMLPGSVPPTALELR
jgi:putative transposase